MQKLIFGIFAHPDDEAFGPSGTFLKEVENGAELHLITLTIGQNGTNPDNHKNLGEVRKREWQRSGELMGAISQHDLGYIDGRLCNIDMIEACETIQAIVRDIAADREVTVEFVTMDMNGISGHIDHIVAARAAVLAFYRLREDPLLGPKMRRVRLICIPKSLIPTPNTVWLYMEAGRRDEEIAEVVDARDKYDEIIEIMRAHHTQRGDGEMHIQTRGKDIGLNYFMILE